MSSLPYMNFYPKDILTDVRMTALTTEQKGVFLWLICLMWAAEGKLKEAFYTHTFIGLSKKKSGQTIKINI